MPPVESDADRESFFNEDEFADRVDTDAGHFFGNFDAAHAKAAFEAVEFSSRSPELECSTADAERCDVTVRGKRLQIKGKNYTVREYQPDGTGTSVIILDAVR